MARLCIRVLPNNHPTDPSMDLFRTQLGDVVCVVEDSHVFSFGELNCGQYRFIQVSGVTQADMIYLIESIYDAQEKLVRLRKVGFDAAVLSSGPWRNRTTVTKAQIDSITVVRV